MQSSATHNSKTPRQSQTQRQGHLQDKGPKFDVAFQSVLVGQDRRSKATARHCDQKR